MLAGACGGVSEAILAVTPIETLKTRVTDDVRRGTKNYTGSFDAVVKILKSEGPAGLYMGFWTETWEERDLVHLVHLFDAMGPFISCICPPFELWIRGSRHPSVIRVDWIHQRESTELRSKWSWWESTTGHWYLGVSENSVPLFTQWLMIIIPIKWLFVWEYTLFSDKPIWDWELLIWPGRLFRPFQDDFPLAPRLGAHHRQASHQPSSSISGAVLCQAVLDRWGQELGNQPHLQRKLGLWLYYDFIFF